jgi:hypothetical protein
VKVYFRQESLGSWRPIPGPADLTSLSDGRVRITPPISDVDRAIWAIALGLYAMRGGTVKRDES